MRNLDQAWFNWLSDDERESMFSQLNRKMPRGRGELKYRQLPDNLDKKEVAGKKHIVFVSYYPQPIILKKCKILREKLNCYVTFIACCIREETEIEQWVNQAYEIEDYHELKKLCMKTAPHALCVNLTTSVLILGVICSEICHQTRFVADIGDLMLFYYSDSEVIDCRIERQILKRCHAYTHRMPEKAIREMEEIFDLKVEGFEIQNLGLKDIYCGKNEESRDCDRNIVFTGGIVPYKIALERGYESSILFPFIDALTSQNISIDVFVNQNAREMFWEEHSGYFQASEKNEYFRFSKGIPFHKLPSAIMNFQFGIIYENMMDTAVNRKHYQYNFATKVFSYVEAGLPILIHSRADYMREYILDHGIGIEYDLTRMDCIGNIINRSSIELLRENVSRYRNEVHMENTIPALKQAFDLS